MATTVTPHVNPEIACTPTLWLAFALGVKQWKLGFTTGAAPRPRERHLPTGDGHAVLAESRRAKSRFGLPEAARVGRCYEAGRAGLWLHRCCVSPGVENVVVDAARLAGKRRSRRAQPERLEVHKRLTGRRHVAGAKTVWSVGRVPSVAEADRRQWPRALWTTQRDRPRVSNRSTGLRAGYGMRLAFPGEVETALEAGRSWDGPPLPAAWRARLQGAWPKVQQLTEQIGSLAADRRAGWSTPGFTGAQSACGIGWVTQRGPPGEQGVGGQRAPRITQPPAPIEGHAPVGPSTGTRSAGGGKTIKRA